MYETWGPIIGPNFASFIQAQPEEARDAVRLSSLKILSRCKNPKQAGAQKSHLIVGEVQSGKTMSFTGVISLARDNKVPIIIVIGGTKVKLLEQTVTRLKRDLQIGGNGGANPWKLFQVHADVKPADKLPKKKNEINAILDQWQDPNVPSEFSPTVVIATLKTKSSLETISKVFEALDRSDLENTPVLIVDDEVDQAGLNVARKANEESSVYAAIGRLRGVLPNNDYLMYTATPQAPLLLKIGDHLAPDTVTVLESGSDYVGGKDLFGDDNHFVLNIPANDVAQSTNPDMRMGPPASLKFALSYYLVSLAIAQKRGNPKPCSMLVHPGTAQAVHTKHAEWITAILQFWKTMLGDISEQSFDDCLKADFEDAFDLLKQTVDLKEIWPAEDEFAMRRDIGRYIALWIPQVEVRIMNSAPDAEDISPDEWRSHPGWILIGGFNLERGFTVENLTVTYMPRGAGVGNADSIQQRGRFFGYKRKYFDLLKGWLATDVSVAFHDYISHENHMRSELAKLDAEESLVSQWRRNFLLDPSLRPTRRAVIKLLVRHDRFIKGFIYAQQQLFDPCLQEGKESSLLQFENLMSDAYRHPLDTRMNVEEGEHLTKRIPISKVLDLLVDLPMSPQDRDTLDTRILALQNLVDEQSDVECEFNFMSSLKLRSRGVEKSSMVSDVRFYSVENLFAGRSENYVGDRKLVSDELVTVQIHHVTPHIDDEEFFPSVLAAAIHWPESLRQGVIWELAGQRG